MEKKFLHTNICPAESGIFCFNSNNWTSLTKTPPTDAREVCTKLPQISKDVQHTGMQELQQNIENICQWNNNIF